MNIYLIDLERINELTGFTSEGKSLYGDQHKYPISSRLIKGYLETYQLGISKHITDDQYNNAIENLLFNKILINKRDRKISKILDLD
jgi:hypothetical protein